jgi:hypothetical protein
LHANTLEIGGRWYFRLFNAFNQNVEFFNKFRAHDASGKHREAKKAKPTLEGRNPTLERLSIYFWPFKRL